MKTPVSVIAVLGFAAALAASGAGAQATRERAYPGAPPTVPHEVEERKGMCQDCHATGTLGAPVTPHPARAGYCAACHVPQEETATPFPPPR
jgi:cytochrome c-type protein NapB